MQSAKTLLICMDASSEVTGHAQANGRDEGDNNSDGIRQSGAMVGNRATPSIQGQKSQKRRGRKSQKKQIKKRRKSGTSPDSTTSKSDICEPVISRVAFR